MLAADKLSYIPLLYLLIRYEAYLLNIEHCWICFTTKPKQRLQGCCDACTYLICTPDRSEICFPTRLHSKRIMKKNCAFLVFLRHSLTLMTSNKHVIAALVHQNWVIITIAYTRPLADRVGDQLIVIFDFSIVVML